MQHNINKGTTTRTQDVQVQNIIFSKLEDSPYITSQKVSLISYKQHRNKLLAQTPEFITETYGILKRVHVTTQ